MCDRGGDLVQVKIQNGYDSWDKKFFNLISIQNGTKTRKIGIGHLYSRAICNKKKIMLPCSWVRDVEMEEVVVEEVFVVEVVVEVET